MVREKFEIPVWGTVLFLDVSSKRIDKEAISHAVDSVKGFVNQVDLDFSTYKDGSYISRLRRNEIAIADCPEMVREIWGLCAIARDLTEGAFDPWAVASGFDP